MNPGRSVDILNGYSYAYFEVFEEKNGLAMRPSEQEDVQYYVYDWYCMNPSCECYNVYLQFNESQKQQASERSSFTILLSLLSKEYTFIHKNKISERQANQVVKNALNDNDSAALLKKRYKRMKTAGRKVIQWEVNPASSEQERKQLPCLCGNGSHVPKSNNSRFPVSNNCFVCKKGNRYKV